MLLGRSPVRISFAGGGTDMPEYFDKFGGVVITTTINHFTYVMGQKRRDKNFQIFSPDFESHNVPTIWNKLEAKTGTELPVAVIKFLNYKSGLNVMLSSDVPPRSGLGSSSALAVNLVNVVSMLKGKRINNSKIAETAHNIERNYLNWPMGKQDEYISAIGGFKKLVFSQKGVKAINVNLSKKSFNELQENLLLFFISSRTSTKILPSQINKINKKDPKILESLDTVKSLANSMYDQLQKSNILGFGELLHKGWLEKKKFSTNVSNDKIDKLYNSAITSGAVGGKLTGAGGGGHMLLYCEKNKQARVVKKMQSHGIHEVKFNFHNEGAKIFNLYDYK
jgi:D-glycero-alpha-D-manno-heptose-7-phosphate kinase